VLSHTLQFLVSRIGANALDFSLFLARQIRDLVCQYQSISFSKADDKTPKFYDNNMFNWVHPELGPLPFIPSQRCMV
jgi:hypothetical protein